MLHLIEVFKAGKHVSASGESITFSEKEVAAIAANYDPALHKAPLVVGHPKDNSPSFGRAASFGVVGGKLFASCDEVDASFAEAVNAKRYPKVSLSLYKPSSPSNPKPGVYYPRHIGFLGGMPPAVKGLADASFAGGADDFVSLELAFAEGDAPATAPAGEQPKPPASEEKPKADDDEMKSKVDALMKALPATLDDAARDKAAKFFAELLATQPKPAETAEHAERRRKLEEGERALANEKRTMRREKNATFLNGLREKGVMLPVSQETALAFMDRLHGDGADVASFGESETRPADQIFREDFLSRIPPAVSFSEVSAAGGEDRELDAEQLGKRAAAHREEQRAKGVNISQTQAVHEVSKKR